MSSISETAKILSKLPVGHRAWFWFCPALPVSQSRLLLASFEKDPGMSKIQKMIEINFERDGAVMLTQYARKKNTS